jgi:hypothetical protein
VPIKFSLGGNYGTTNLFATGYPRLVSCTSTEAATAATPVESFVDVPSDGLKYDPVSQQYLLNFQVKGKVFKNKCYKLEVKLNVCPVVRSTILQVK